MLYAVAIRFNSDEQNKNLKTIKEIQIEQDNNQWTKTNGEEIKGFFKKEDIHDWLIKYKYLEIEVKSNKSSKRPHVKPEEQDGVKYVKSEPDDTKKDNLLSLPEK